MNINEAIKYLNDMRANCMNHKIDNYKDTKRAKKAEALQIAIESLCNSNITEENATDAYAVKDLDARESELLADACRCIDHYNDMTAVQKIELEGDLRKALSDAQEYNKMKTAAGQELKIGDIVETYPWEYDGRMCVIMLKDDGTVSIMTDRGAIGTLHKEQLRKTGERVSMVIPDRAQNTWTVRTN